MGAWNFYQSNRLPRNAFSAGGFLTVRGRGMKSRHERAALFGFFRNCSETLISSDVNREGYAYRAIESAKIDGAGEYTIFFKMVLPLSKPVISALGIFTAVGTWNDYTQTLYYTKSARYSDTVVLYALDYQGKCFCSISWGDHECRRIECPDNHVKFCGKLQNH